ncbi:iron-sulfur cluster biosynthesis family protein [Neobacillus sp. K501]
MEIKMTPAAAEKINERTEGKKGFLKLKYDTEGCGCAVSGVIALWFVPDVDEDDVRIETNSQPVYIEKAKTVFFDDQMTIDFSREANSFQLKSPGQILNGRMSMIIKTD